MRSDADHETVNQLAESKSFDYFIEKTVWDKLSSLAARYKIFWAILVGLVVVIFALLGYKAIELDNLVTNYQGKWQRSLDSAGTKIATLKLTQDSFEKTREQYEKLIDKQEALLDTHARVLDSHGSVLSSQTDGLNSRINFLSSETNEIEKHLAGMSRLREQGETIVKDLETSREKIDARIKEIQSHVDVKMTEVDSALKKLELTRSREQRRVFIPLRAYSMKEKDKENFSFGDKLSFELHESRNDERGNRQLAILQVKINDKIHYEAPATTGQNYRIADSRYWLDIIASTSFSDNGESKWRVDFVVAIESR